MATDSNDQAVANPDDVWFFEGRTVQIVCCAPLEEAGAYPIMENFGGAKKGYRMTLPKDDEKKDRHTDVVTKVCYRPEHSNVLLVETVSGARYAVVSPF